VKVHCHAGFYPKATNEQEYQEQRRLRAGENVACQRVVLPIFLVDELAYIGVNLCRAFLIE